MGLHFWLIPVMVLLGAGVAVLYLVIRHGGGSGHRNEGRMLLDKPVEKNETKAEWNYYSKP